MVAGTTGLEGSARGRMTVLAAVIGIAVGYLGASLFDGTVLMGLIFGGLSAGFSCAIVSGVVAGARRRGGTAALTVLVVFAAFVIAGLTGLFAPFAILPAAGLAWLGISRSRRADRKHAGLRVLR